MGALLIALTMVAFTPSKSGKGKFVDVYFTFDRAHNNPTQTNMQNPAKWLLSPNQDPSGCILTPERGCKIKVDASDVQSGQLKPGTIIPTGFYATDVYFVNTGGDVTGAYNTSN